METNLVVRYVWGIGFVLLPATVERQDWPIIIILFVVTLLLVVLFRDLKGRRK